MKKTPKDLASPPAFVALNAMVAASALTGMLSQTVGSAKAKEPTYDTKIQKSVHDASPAEMATYTTTYTQSYPPLGTPGGWGNDDTKTTSDQF